MLRILRSMSLQYSIMIFAGMDITQARPSVSCVMCVYISLVVNASLSEGLFHLSVYVDVAGVTQAEINASFFLLVQRFTFCLR